MAAILFDAQLVVARLTTQASPLKKVGGAADLPATEEAVARLSREKLPAAFVLPLAESAGANLTGTQVVSQRLSVRFGVVLAVSNLRDARGEQAQADLRQARSAVLDQLLGWEPTTDYDVCVFGSGRLLQLSDQVLWWQDDFITALYLRA